MSHIAQRGTRGRSEGADEAASAEPGRGGTGGRSRAGGGTRLSGCPRPVVGSVEPGGLSVRPVVGSGLVGIVGPPSLRQPPLCLSDSG